MGKQRTIEKIRAEREAGTYQPPGTQPDKVVELFREHYELSRRSMSVEHAVAIAHDAVQRHLVTLREQGKPPSTTPAYSDKDKADYEQRTRELGELHGPNNRGGGDM